MRKLQPEVLDTIAALGFDVYQTPYALGKSYLYFADGARIGYLQCSDWGGLSLSTVHVPNQTTGTGFRMADTFRPEALTRAELERAFAIAPDWASNRERATVRKWRDVGTFVKSNGLELVRKASEIEAKA